MCMCNKIKWQHISSINFCYKLWLSCSCLSNLIAFGKGFPCPWWEISLHAYLCNFLSTFSFTYQRSNIWITPFNSMWFFLEEILSVPCSMKRTIPSQNLLPANVTIIKRDGIEFQLLFVCFFYQQERKLYYIRDTKSYISKNKFRLNDIYDYFININ